MSTSGLSSSWKTMWRYYKPMEHPPQGVNPCVTGSNRLWWSCSRVEQKGHHPASSLSGYLFFLVYTSMFYEIMTFPIKWYVFVGACEACWPWRGGLQAEEGEAQCHYVCWTSGEKIYRQSGPEDIVLTRVLGKPPPAQNLPTTTRRRIGSHAWFVLIPSGEQLISSRWG